MARRRRRGVTRASARPEASGRRTTRRRPRTAGRAAARLLHRNPVWAAGALVLLHLVLAALAFVPTPHTGGDNAAYIALARSLLEHRAFLSLYDPATPPHTQYPPAFPGMLALATVLGLGSWVKLKLVVLACSAAAVAMTFLWIRRRGRPVLGAGVALLLAISPSVLEQSHWVLSDIPFWFFTVLALWGFERLPPGLRIRFVVATLAGVLAYFTRSAGLPLVLAIIVWLGLRRRWQQLAVFAAVLVPLALLWYVRARTQGGVDYVSQFWAVDPYTPQLGRIDAGDFFRRIGSNAGNYARIHLPILLAGTASAAVFLVGLATLLLAAGGWARRIRRPCLPELLLPLYLGLLLVWPAVWSGERFLLPAMPLILFYAGDALVAGVRLMRPRAGFVAGAAAVALVGLNAVPAIVSELRTGTLCTTRYRAGDPYPCLGPEWRDFFDMAGLAERALPDDAVVLSRKPRLFWGLSGVRGRNYPMSQEAVDFFAAAADAGARYVVFDRLGRQAQVFLAPVILQRPAAFCLISSTPATATTMLGILPGADTMQDRTDLSASLDFAVCPDEYWKSPAARDAEAPPVTALPGQGDR